MYFLKEWREFLIENPYNTLSEWVKHIGAEGTQSNISKEESRNIMRTLSLRAFEAPYKVMLIWLPELMHPAASNAILKILEEPSPLAQLFLRSRKSCGIRQRVEKSCNSSTAGPDLRVW